MNEISAITGDDVPSPEIISCVPPTAMNPLNAVAVAYVTPFKLLYNVVRLRYLSTQLIASVLEIMFSPTATYNPL